MNPLDVDYVPQFPGLKEVATYEVPKGPAILKCSWPSAGNERQEETVYVDCMDEFGTPRQIQWFIAPFDLNYNMTNELFLEGVTPFFLPTTAAKPVATPTASKTSKKATSNKSERHVNEDPGPSTSKNFSSTVSGLASVTAKDQSVSTPSHVVHSGYPTAVDSVPKSRKDPQSKTADQPTKTPRTGVQRSRFTKVNTAGAQSEERVPDRRSLVISILEDQGVDFEHCETSEDLCESLSHATLGKVQSHRFTYANADEYDRLVHDVSIWSYASGH